MSTPDPFLEVQSEVVELLNTTRPLFQSYLRIRSSASSPNNPELRDARQELETNLQDIATDLEDLVQGVKAVEGDHYKYGLELEEVQRRRTLVQSIGDEVADMRRELQSTVTDLQRDRKSKLPDPNEFDSGDEHADDDYQVFEQQRQVEIMQEQDQQLDGVFKTVGMLRMQADTMGRELEEQADMLDDVDNITDRVNGKVQAGLKNLGTVIKRNEGLLDVNVLVFTANNVQMCILLAAS